MSYTSERDQAAKEYSYHPKLHEKDLTLDWGYGPAMEKGYKAGADWAIQSEVVKGLIEALNKYCSNKATYVLDDNGRMKLLDDELTPAGKALAAYEQAKKEVV